jgi:hypothetical protein
MREKLQERQSEKKEVSKLLWYLGIMGAIFFVLFCLGIWVEKANQRREIDPIYDARVTKFWDKVDPYFKFSENLFWWSIAVLFIYFIALR